MTNRFVFDKNQKPNHADKTDKHSNIRSHVNANSGHSGNFPPPLHQLINHNSKKRYVKAIQISGALAVSAALGLAMIPMFDADESMESTLAAPVAHPTSFAGKSASEVKNMMKSMTIDEIVDAMPLHDKVSQMFVTYTDNLSKADGTSGSDLLSVNQQVIDKMAAYPVGGVCYFRSNLTGGVSTAKKMSDDFQEYSKYGMLVSVDEEGGYVQRIGGPAGSINPPYSNPSTAKTTLYPYSEWTGELMSSPGINDGTQGLNVLRNMYSYEADGVDTAYDNALKLAENCKAVGANWDYAPVVDVDLEAGNLPAKKGRTYSKDVALTSELTTSAIRGFNDAGIACSAKHFPGHGSIVGDTHNGFVAQNKTLAELEESDLLVYENILDSDVELDSIMLGHMTTTNIAGGDKPASVSPYWINYIRNELNYDGIVLTDGMKMDALRDCFEKNSDAGYTQASIAAFEAGIDVFLLSGTPFASIDAIEELVNSDETGEMERRVDESVKRIMKLKRKVGAIPDITDDEATLIHKDGTHETGSLIDMWNKARNDSTTGDYAPCVRLNHDVTLEQNLLAKKGKAITLDLHGHKLDRGLSDVDATANEHVFVIEGGTFSDTTVVVQDSSPDFSGYITGANGTDGTIAYVTKSKSKFIVDSGKFIGNKGTSLVYGDADATLRLGVQPTYVSSGSLQGEDNHSGPISFESNSISKCVIDLSATLHIMGNTSIKNNSATGIYFNGNAAQLNIQERGLTAGPGSIDISASDSWLANHQGNTPALSIATRSNYSTDADVQANALVFRYFDGAYAVEQSKTASTAIVLVKVNGDVAYVSTDESVSDAGTFDDMFELACANGGGTLTFMRDVKLETSRTYDFAVDVTIDLNGRHIDVSTDKEHFIGANGATVIITDSHQPLVSSSRVSNDSAPLKATYNAASRELVYYEDVYDSNEVQTYKKIVDFGTLGSISMESSASMPSAIFMSGDNDDSTKFVVDNGVVTSSGISAAHIGSGSMEINGGYFVGMSVSQGSAVWIDGENANLSVAGGVFAANECIGANGAGAIYVSGQGAHASIDNAVISGNYTNANGGGIAATSSSSDNSSIVISNSMVCHNAADGFGGGIYVDSENATAIANSLVSNNASNLDGAGVFAKGTGIPVLSGDSVQSPMVITKNKGRTGGFSSSERNSVIFDANGYVVVSANKNIAGEESDVILPSKSCVVGISGKIVSPASSIGVSLANPLPLDIIASSRFGYSLLASDAVKFFMNETSNLFPTKNGEDVALVEGQSSYLSEDGTVSENGKLVDLWKKYFSDSNTMKNGTITLNEPVTINQMENLCALADVNVSNANLELNGNVLRVDSNTNSSAITIKGSASLVISDIAGKAFDKESFFSTQAGRHATWDEDEGILEYYVTKHDKNDDVVTKKHVTDLSNLGAFDYQTNGNNPKGAIHVTNTGKLVINNGRITSSKARAFLVGNESGNSSAQLVINGGYVVGSESTGIGSIALGRNGSTMTINGGVIAANSTTSNGGFWLNPTNENNIVMTGGIISGNRANSGAAFYSSSGSNNSISIQGATSAARISGDSEQKAIITNNDAVDGDGGAIYLSNSASSSKGISVSNATISANKAKIDGGAISTNKTATVDNDAHLDANEAMQRGGAVKATNILLNSTCIQENTAQKSAGLYPTNGISFTGGKIFVVNNKTYNGDASDIDITRETSDMNPSDAKITGVIDTSSKIGLLFRMGDTATTGSKKLLSSTIVMNDKHSNVFFDDDDVAQVLRFKDASTNSDGIYVVTRNAALSNAVEESVTFSLTRSGVIHGQLSDPQSQIWNVDYNNKQFVRKGILDTSCMTLRTWNRYRLTYDESNGKYKCDLVMPPGNNDDDHTKAYMSSLAADQVLMFSFPPVDAGLKVGDYVDFTDMSGGSSWAPGTSFQDSVSGIGKYNVYKKSETTPESASYTIHYLTHYIDEATTDDIYIEDSSRRSAVLTGKVGDLVFADIDATRGCNTTNQYNVISKELRSNATSTLGKWYHVDDILNPMVGDADCINDLYIIFDAEKPKYYYDVEYYDADTGEMLGEPFHTSTKKIPVRADDGIKEHVYGYSLDEYDSRNVLELNSNDFNGENVPSMKLYMRSWPEYSLETWIDNDGTGYKLNATKKIKAQAGSEVNATSKQKTLTGYDYVKTPDTVERITVAADGTSVIRLYFEKEILRDYSIRYIDRATDQTVAIINVPNVKAGTRVSLLPEQEEYLDKTANKKYRLNQDDERNSLVEVIPRSGTVELVVYTDCVDTVDVFINKYEFSNGKWQRMSGTIRQVVAGVDAHSCFDVMNAETRQRYNVQIDYPGYILLSDELNPMHADPKTITAIADVGSASDLTKSIELYYAKVFDLDEEAVIPVQKTSNDNGLEPINKDWASTKDLINVTLYDYGWKVNDKSLNSTGYPYPLFKGNTLTKDSEAYATLIGNMGEVMINDYWPAYYAAESYWGASTSPINKLAATSADNKTPSDQFNYSYNANAAVNGLSYALSRNGTSINPLSPSLDSSGAPQIVDGSKTTRSLDYLFPSNASNVDYSSLTDYDYETVKIADHIDGLFDYDDSTGYYSYSSYRNHAELNTDDPDNPRFDVYDVMLSPDAAVYPFGSFMPFNKINDEATSFDELDADYFYKLASYCAYKAQTTTNETFKYQYENARHWCLFCASYLNEHDVPGDTAYDKLINMYFLNSDIMHKCERPTFTINPQDIYKDPITGEKVWNKFETPQENRDDYYDHMYQIDFDEMKNFFYSATFDMNFVQPPNGQIRANGENRNPMLFDFEGDDDVIIYIDDKLFLNLAGIHRQVGGSIDFERGIISYRDLDYNRNTTVQAKYPASATYSYVDDNGVTKTQPLYRDITNGIVHFDEVLRDAFYAENHDYKESVKKASALLNENGTFTDWSEHSFKMFYVERGSGSGVLQMKFNLPLIPKNSLLVAKNLTSTGEDGSSNLIQDYQPILGDDVFYSMQLVRADSATGEILQDARGNVVPYLVGEEYMIYEDGKFTGRTRTVDENGVLTLRANQFAVLSKAANPGEAYVVRELIDYRDVDQYDKTTVSNGKAFNSLTSKTITHIATSDPSNSLDIDGINYLVRKSQPLIVPDDSNELSSTLFENNLDLEQLGALAIAKDMIEGDSQWDANDEFYIAVMLNDRPMQSKQSSGEKTTYYVYDGAYVNGELDLSNAKKTQVTMEQDGIIKLKAGQVAVLRYMIAGTTYEIYEIENPDNAGSYHPVYDKDSLGNPITSGRVETGSANEPTVFHLANQKADDLVISKTVEREEENASNKEYPFEISIKSTNKDIDGTYEYEVFDKDENVVNTAALPSLADATAAYNESSSSGDPISTFGVKPQRDTLTFAKDEDGNSHCDIALHADEKIVIYGLPYGCSYEISEDVSNHEYRATSVGDSNNGIVGMETVSFVLGANQTVSGGSNDIEMENSISFVNTKNEVLSVTKEVDCGILGAFDSSYDANRREEFSFDIIDAALDGHPLVGEYVMVVTSSWGTEQGTATEETKTISFDENGNATFKLSHGQTAKLYLPRDTTCSLNERELSAYDMTYEIQKETGDETQLDSIILSDNVEVTFMNHLIFNTLPTTGGLGLLVSALALLGGGIVLKARNMKKRKIKEDKNE